MSKQLITLAAISVVIISCSLFNQFGNIGNPDSFSDNIENVSPEDKEINMAIERAQETLPLFIENFQNPKPSQTDFSIKSRFLFDSDGSAEHMWISDLEYKDGRFSGSLGDEPVYVKNLRFGDPVTVDSKDITDWMIIDNNQIYGAFTLHVFLDRMTTEEAEQFKEDSGLIISDEPLLP